ncbi:MAG: sulfatase-like hydrolase/transferase, partial [Pseudomonadota bacterium]
VTHLRRIMNSQPIVNEAVLRRVIAGYLALVAHLDTEIGKVLDALLELGLEDTTRVIYTSDHGEMCGAHGLFGKSCLLEESIGVPLIAAGPGVPAGRVVEAPVSQVDLFPTILEAAGVALEDDDADLPGLSLWPDVEAARHRTAFAEYHAAGSKSGSFMLRQGRFKLLYHVGMPRQLFDLQADPGETNDLGPDHPEAVRLETRLREICDPEEVDARAKHDQRAWIEHWGGADTIAGEELLIYTPPPGEPAEMEQAG